MKYLSVKFIAFILALVIFMPLNSTSQATLEEIEKAKEDFQSEIEKQKEEIKGAQDRIKEAEERFRQKMENLEEERSQVVSSQAVKDSLKQTYVDVGKGIIRFGKDIQIGEKENIPESAVTIGGNIEILGRVGEDVVSVGGNIKLGPNAYIGGDVVTVGGQIEKAPGAQVKGNFVEVGKGKFIGGLFQGICWPICNFLGLIFEVTKLFFLLLIGLILVVLFPKQMEMVSGTVRSDFWKSLLLGLGMEIIILPLFVLLCVSIVGIPIALLIQPVFYICAFLVGYAAVGLSLGRIIDEKTALSFKSQVAALVVGIIGIELFLLVGAIIKSLIGFMSWPFTVIGWIIACVAWTTGLGAVTLTLVRNRKKRTIEENTQVAT